MISKDWTVYILECRDKTYYCGVCKSANLMRRLEEHNSGTGAKYTSGRTPVELLAHRKELTKSAAYRLEYFVKRQRKKSKQVFLAAWQPVERKPAIP